MHTAACIIRACVCACTCAHAYMPCRVSAAYVGTPHCIHTQVWPIACMCVHRCIPCDMHTVYRHTCMSPVPYTHPIPHRLCECTYHLCLYLSSTCHLSSVIIIIIILIIIYLASLYHLSTNLPIPAHLSCLLSVPLSVCLPAYLAIYLPMDVYPSILFSIICLSVCLSICVSISVPISICPRPLVSGSLETVRCHRDDIPTASWGLQGQ